METTTMGLYRVLSTYKLYHLCSRDQSTFLNQTSGWSGPCQKKLFVRKENCDDLRGPSQE